jgi:hypothetical protein
MAQGDSSSCVRAFFSSRTIFVASESTGAAKAAAVQEDFDVLVFVMPLLALREPRPTPEEIAAVAGPDTNIRGTAAKERLIAGIRSTRDLDGTASIAVTQARHCDK